MKKAVITGGTGAIGVSLTTECIKQGYEVYTFVRKGSKRRDQIPKSDHVHIVKCDLDEIKDFDADQLTSCDYFFHMGWSGTFGVERNDTHRQLKNIEYTIDAVELAARLGCKKFIGVGSQSEFGRFEGALNATVPTRPENPYGIAKLCAGQMAKIKCNQLNIEFNWMRFLSVYGPYDNQRTMIISTIKTLLKHERASFTPAHQMWDYLYADDAGRGLLLVAEKGVNGKTYCIGCGRAEELREYIYKIRNHIDPSAKLGFGDIAYSNNQVMYLCADITEFTKDTHFEPLVSFDDGIERTIEWVKSLKE